MSIDLNFRPTGYSDFENPVALALNGIKGQKRREMVRDIFEAEGERRRAFERDLGPFGDAILEAHASERLMRAMRAACPPTWLGGEYLPDLDPHEVEIARIVLSCVTVDVFSVRARRTPEGYRYSMADEYRTKFTVSPETSERPLSLLELSGLIDTARGSVLIADKVEEEGETGSDFVESWWNQERRYGRSLARCTAYARVESEQYRSLGAYYEERARQWRIARAAEAPRAVGGEAA